MKPNKLSLIVTVVLLIALQNPYWSNPIANGAISGVYSCISTPNIRTACSCVFRETGSWDKDGTDMPCVHQIAGFVCWRSVCVYLTSLRSLWLWELRPPSVRHCRYRRWHTFLAVSVSEACWKMSHNVRGHVYLHFGLQMTRWSNFSCGCDAPDVLQIDVDTNVNWLSVHWCCEPHVSNYSANVMYELVRLWGFLITVF